MKIKFLFVAFVTVCLCSCGGSKFAISAGDENLSALTKVTDSEEPCVQPYGGDNGKNLFFSARSDKKYWNIYKKENAFSNAMSQKTSGKNNNTRPVYNRINDKIAFSCQNEGMSSSDIYLINASKGKTLSPITESSDAYESHPSFSKDGNLVAYDKVSYSFFKKINFGSLFGLGETTVIVQNSEIWVKNLTTGESTLIGNGAEPSFSPVENKIAYTKYSSDAGSCSIWTMDLDGSNPVQVTDAKKGYSHNPRWSPDGKRLVFQSFKKDKKDYDLYIISSDGEKLTQITTNKSWDGEPYWSNDGYIYFTSDRGGKQGNYQIWRFKLYD
jgi:TolB protein